MLCHSKNEDIYYSVHNAVPDFVVANKTKSYLSLLQILWKRTNAFAKCLNSDHL